MDDDTLANRDVARLRASVKHIANEDTFGGRFTLIGEAGTGGMGIVYEAKDRDRGRRVAIKIITGLPGPAERARFAAEAEVLERLDHPAIVDYVDHGVTRDGEPYIAMEWLEGESLATRLKRGPLSVIDTVTLGQRIAGALEHAHDRGVVHRDLKPSNIFLVDGKLEEAHLIDFGVAKRTDKSLTHTGQLIGTPGYMAPEQVRGEKSVGAGADLFALGCVLYESLTGRDAFGGREVMEVLARLLLENPTPVEELVQGVPPRLAHLIGGMLSKEAEHRVSKATLVRSELSAIRQALVEKDTTALDLRPKAIAARQPAKRPRPPVWWIALAGGALAVAAVTLVIVLVPGDEPQACNETTKATCQKQCDANDASACFFLARDKHAHGDHEAGRVADGRACHLGNNDGCYKAGESLLKLSKPHDKADARRVAWLAEAKQLFELGCERKDAECCRELGKQVSRNIGAFDPDPARAFELVEWACTVDNKKACNALRDMIGDADNGATPEMRAHAQTIRDAACARLADLQCDR